MLGGKEKKLLEMVASIAAGVVLLSETVVVDDGDNDDVFFPLRRVVLRSVCRGEDTLALSRERERLSFVDEVLFLKIDGSSEVLREL